MNFVEYPESGKHAIKVVYILMLTSERTTVFRRVFLGKVLDWGNKE